MHKVFLIDDDLFLTKLYTTLLQNEGMHVGVANSGADAIKQLPAFKPDLVVLDLHMPGVTGVDVLRFIRTGMEPRDLPVIVFSNGFVQAMVDKVGDLNAQKVFSKLLCKPKQLVQEIKDLLGALPKAAVEKDTRSALDVAAIHAPEEAMDQLATWMHRLRTDTRHEARRICLIHIYKILQETLRRAMAADAATPRGKLSRALKKLLDDLFDHSDHVTESTMGALDHALQKLFDLCANAHDEQLESETALMDVLSELDD